MAFKLFLTLLVFAGVSQLRAQVLPPDESLTDGPSTVRSESADTTSLLTRETIGAASPSQVRGKAVDSSYVDTLGVGFFKKILAPTYPNPERAAAMSFVLPGAGQIYNKRFAYIKLPVIYAGYAFLIYRGESNRKLSNSFDEAFQLSVKGLEHEYTGTRFDATRILRTNRDRLDKNYQLAYIGVGILHLIQTLEAYTTAHLLDFDMDESLTLTPIILQMPGPSATSDTSTGRLALGLSYTFPTK